MYIEHCIESSYYCNNKGAKTGDNYFYPKIGRTLFDYVINHKPKLIIEFGVLHGFSTTCMAQALKQLGTGKIHSYDLWEHAEYNHGQRLSSVEKTLQDLKLNEFVELKTGNVFELLKQNKVDISDVDLIHIDINNDGDKLLDMFNLLQQYNFKGDVLFEGGIKERDNCWWMKEFNKTPIRNLEFEVLNSNYPGISKIK